MAPLLLSHQTFGRLVQLADHLILCIVDLLKPTDKCSPLRKCLRVFCLHGGQRLLNGLTQAVWQVLPHHDGIVGDQFGDPNDA